MGCNLVKRYSLWIEQEPCHPIWLILKDKELQQKYNTWLYNQVYHYSKIGCTLAWI